MKLQQATRTLKEWLPSVASAAAVLLTAVYAVTRTTHASEGIRDARELAYSLDDAACQAESSTRSQEEIEALAAIRQDLEHRMTDACKPGLVVPELTETARKAGLLVREIQPVEGSVVPGRLNTGSTGQGEEEVRPQYRILVQGEYSQIAEYMELCKSQRIPARIRGFHLTRPKHDDGTRADYLTADMIVEAFLPREQMQQGQDGN